MVEIERKIRTCNMFVCVIRVENKKKSLDRLCIVYISVHVCIKEEAQKYYRESGTLRK